MIAEDRYHSIHRSESGAVDVLVFQRCWRYWLQQEMLVVSAVVFAVVASYRRMVA
jgi:hypothetical protein